MSQRSNFQDVFLSTALPALSAVIMDAYGRYDDTVPRIFNVLGLNTWGDQTTSVAGLEGAPSKSEGQGVAFGAPIEGYDKTYQPVTYAQAVSFTEELIEDERFGIITKTYASLGISMYQTKQVTCMNVFNNGFTDTGPDGVSLFNTAHVLIGGGTYGNRPAAEIAMSVAGIREMEVDMMRQVDHRNLPIMVMPRTFLVPPEIRQTTDELLKSSDRPDTANRATNVIAKSNYASEMSPFLTSATAWFVVADKSQHELRFYNRMSPYTRSWVDEKTGDVNTKIRCRFDVGYSDYIGTWGTTG